MGGSFLELAAHPSKRDFGHFRDEGSLREGVPLQISGSWRAFPAGSQSAWIAGSSPAMTGGGRGGGVEIASPPRVMPWPDPLLSGLSPNGSQRARRIADLSSLLKRSGRQGISNRLFLRLLPTLAIRRTGSRFAARAANRDDKPVKKFSIPTWLRNELCCFLNCISSTALF